MSLLQNPAGPDLDHLHPYLRSFDPARLAHIDQITRYKIDAARVRHAEFILELKGLEEQHDSADNRHLQHHFRQRMDAVRAHIQQAFDTISPYIVR